MAVDRDFTPPLGWNPPLRGARRSRTHLPSRRDLSIAGVCEIDVQFGYGMMEHSRHLVQSWGGGAVILSPRDSDGTQLQRLASDIVGLTNGRVLLDPQFYLPRSDHHRLTAHGYWPDSYETNAFFGGNGLQTMLRQLWTLNQSLQTEAFILPGLMATTVDDAWLATLRTPIAAAQEVGVNAPMYSTVALGVDAVRNMNSIQEVLEEFETLSVEGVYVLAEHPNGDYLVEDPTWLANVLELCGGLRLAGKKVLAGYVNHELLCLGAAAANVVAAGTWMNVRMFSPDRFEATQEEETRRRATWYYCPTSLSEYKTVFLDAAWRQNVLASMNATTGVVSPYAAPLRCYRTPSDAMRRRENGARNSYAHAS